MLRRSLTLQIRAALENPPYIYPEDFETKVTNKDKGRGTHLQINYLCDDGQYFVAVIPHSKSDGKNDYDAPEFSISCRFNPGEITDDQTETVRGHSSLISEINLWVNRIAQDIQSIPLYRAIDEIENRMADVEEKLKDIPDEAVTPEQVAKLHTMLSELERQLKSQIEALEISVDEKRKKIEELEMQFEALHKRSESGNMRQILRSIASRVYRAASDPDLPKLIENGKKIAGLLSGSSSANG